MLKVLSENLKNLLLSFYRQLKLPLIQILDAVLYKTHKTHKINLRPSSMDFGEIPLPRFGYRVIFGKAEEICFD